jgi:hypothetical protein
VTCAYLILAHANPVHLSRLVTALGDDHPIFIHLDAKTDISGFGSIGGPSAHWSRRRSRVYWGEYSMVEAILTLISDALASPVKSDYYILLSGADYPLKSARYIDAFFARNAGVEFISLAAIPSREAGLPLSKVNRFAMPSDRPLLQWLARASSRFGYERDHHRHLRSMQPYGGSTWWALTREACEYILEFAEENEWFCEFFRHTYSSDETFFHTILGNSKFAPAVRRSLMFDDWSAGGRHPEIITEAHLELFEKTDEVTLEDAFGPGELLYARKFTDESAAIVSRLDELIARKDSGAVAPGSFAN